MKKLYEYKISAVKNNEYESVKINDSLTAFNVISKFYCSDISIYESFFLLTVNKGLLTTGYFKISQGGVAGTIVDVKIIAMAALKNLAYGVFLAHNHPSGNMTPSAEDLRTTKKIKRALDFFDITVFDHLILSGTEEDKYFSFADENCLEK